MLGLGGPAPETPGGASKDPRVPTPLFLRECATRTRNRVLESGKSGRREISMKKMIALSMLVLSACAGRQANMHSPTGAFDGISSGETMEGTFRDGTGEGSFRIEKQPDWEDVRNAP